MQAVSLLEALDELVASQLREYIEVGRLRYGKSASTALKQRRSLGIQTEVADFEILVWESGEIEFGYGTATKAIEEHIEITTALELEDVLRRFLATAQSWKE
jgi:hypothetical protein